MAEPAKAVESPPQLPDAIADPQVATVISAFVRQYETKDTVAQDAIIDEAYAPGAVFDDNLFHVTGLPNIKVQFHAVAKLFKEVKVVPQSSSVEVSDGQKVLQLFNKQEYLIGKSRKVLIDCDTTIKLDTNGKITSHYDVWRDRPANFGFLKKIGGSVTSAIMKAVKY